MKELWKDRLTRVVAIVTIVVVILGIMFIRIYNSIGNTPNYDIYIFENGSAKIMIDNIGYVNQLPDGTLVIDGGGKPEGYHYTREDMIGH